MTLEEKIEQVKNFRPIDDTFFEVLADDIGVCQEMLRIILEDEKLIVKDGTTISEYMDCFLQKEIDNAKFPKLTNRVHYLKHEEGGVQKMCEVMEQYSKKAYQQGEEAGKEIGKEIGQRQANIAAIKNMIIRFHATKEVILEDYTESEYNTAIAELESESR